MDITESIRRGSAYRITGAGGAGRVDLQAGVFADAGFVGARVGGLHGWGYAGAVDVVEDAALGHAGGKGGEWDEGRLGWLGLAVISSW